MWSFWDLKENSLYPPVLYLPLLSFHPAAHRCVLSQVRLLLELYRLQGNMTRVKINELKPLKPRFEVPDVLIKEPTTEP